MEEIGRKYPNDKIIHHGYHRFYPRYIEFIKHLPSSGMIEIGLHQESSLLLWLNYFPTTFIYGIDLHKGEKGERFQIITGDQTNLSLLRSVASQLAHPIYFINDDGSHIPQHQLTTFNFMFRHVLQEGGVYIIEDIETSYWKRGTIYGNKTEFGYGHANSLLEKCKDLLDFINREFLSFSDRERVKNRLLVHGFELETIEWISSVSFCQNCIIITKTKKEEDQYRNRKYRFIDYVMDDYD